MHLLNTKRYRPIRFTSLVNSDNFAIKSILVIFNEKLNELFCKSFTEWRAFADDLDNDLIIDTTTCHRELLLHTLEEAVK